MTSGTESAVHPAASPSGDTQLDPPAAEGAGEGPAGASGTAGKGPLGHDCVGVCAGKGGNTDCLCGGSGRAVDAALYLQKRLLRAEEALDFYANPESYHAIAFLKDRPCGGFADDFDEEHGHPDYDRPMPGKLARRVISTPVP